MENEDLKQGFGLDEFWELICGIQRGSDGLPSVHDYMKNTVG